MAEYLAPVPPPDARIEDMSIREILADDLMKAYLRTYRGILALYRWIKTQPEAPPSTPPPTTPPPSVVESRIWPVDVRLDQGRTGHCVGFGGVDWMACAPVQDPGVKNQDGHDLYYWIKSNIDGEPGQENGSTVHSLAKALKIKGRLESYVWASNADEVRAWLLSRGPVVFGTDWTSDMFDPRTDGMVTPTGAVEGGHCYLCIGFHEGFFLFLNSWGNGWGKDGMFIMQPSDVNKLLMADGAEAMAALELPL
jgi:hypothetical protein